VGELASTPTFIVTLPMFRNVKMLNCPISLYNTGIYSSVGGINLAVLLDTSLLLLIYELEEDDYLDDEEDGYLEDDDGFFFCKYSECVRYS
jgi:hypothetical protein